MILLLMGIVKLVYVIIMFIPIMILWILDLIRSFGQGYPISNDESWSYKVTKFIDFCF